MARKKTKKRAEHRQPQRRTPQKAKPESTGRLLALDALRGAAIILMVVDHIAFLADISIEPNNVRIATRLCMPLFAGILGFFLAKSNQLNIKRLTQLALATLAVNALAIPILNSAEILASLLICVLIFWASRPLFPIFILAAAFASWDPSVAENAKWWLYPGTSVLDYPITICLACVAIGCICQRWSAGVAMLASLLVLLSSFFWQPPSSYALIAVPLSTLLILFASQKIRLPWFENGKRKFDLEEAATWPFIRWLTVLGRYPLSAYTGHYLVILIARWIQVTN